MASAPSSSQRSPWGSFPAEQYLIHNWNEIAGEDKTEQYRRLIRAFLASGKLVNRTGSEDTDDSQPHAMVSDDQINSMLKPWRPEKLRTIAGGLRHEQKDEVVILRTHYSDNPADDELLQQILQHDKRVDPDFEADKQWWRVLDDRALFDFGSAWESVLDVLPELTRRGKGKESSLGPQQLQEATTSHEQYGRSAHDYVQAWVTVGAVPLAVLDEEAFATSRLKLVFLDANGNAVRSVRVETPVLAEYRMSSFQGSVDEMEAWEEADVATKYRVDGSVGKVLYQMVDDLRTA